MAETIIISKQDISESFPLGKNLNDNRINPHILRAQQTELKPFLGDQLYYDFVENIDDANYALLFAGGEYEESGEMIYFSGVKSLLSAWAYSRIIKNNQVFVTRGGVTQKDTEESTQHGNPIVQQRNRDAQSEAIRIQNEVRLFLEKKRSDYPLWRRSVNTNSPTTESFKMTKI